MRKRNLLLISKQMWNKFLETSAPGEPFMMSAWRYIDIKLDTKVFQLLRHLLGTEVFL